MKTKLHYVFSITLFFMAFSMFSQSSYWKQSDGITQNNSLRHLDANNYTVFDLDIELFKQELIGAPRRGQFSGHSNTVLEFPNDKGILERFRIIEVPTLSDELSLQYPDIKTYLGFGIDDPGTRVRFSVTPRGLKTMTTYVDKPMVLSQPLIPGNIRQNIVYNRNADPDREKSFTCLTEDIPNIVTERNASRDANDQMLRTYRMAISTPGEYTNSLEGGGNPTSALAAVVASLNRTNEVFEVDMAITFSLVTGEELIYPDAGTDPYTGNYNSQLQTTLTSVVGEANYDIGHLFQFGTNNGNAGCIGCVCEDGSKGSGFSSHTFLDNDGGPYMSDFFDIDYVPHEIGHQMGANHTHAEADNTPVNFEPGSGTTIMGYAGITSSDVQDHSDPYFHYGSIDQILTNVNSAPNDCAMLTPITNNPPVANAGPDRSIPQGTAFKLTGSAMDADGADELTYMWEQIDDGLISSGDFGPTNTTGPLWRSRPPSSSPDRYMPVLSRVISGQLTESNPVETVDNSSWETVSTVARDLNFALIVRDRSESGGVGQSPQSDFDTMTVTVDDASGPFEVTSQTTNVSWLYGNPETVTWDVAGTDGGVINAMNVDILLSIDGGLTFPFTLATDVPNSGTATVTVPNTGGPTTMARIIVTASDNIFYAMNSSDFSILEPEFSLTLDENAVEVCSPSDAIYSFVYNTFGGFSGTTDFTAEGLPAGASAIFLPTSVSADGTNVTMTISGIGSVSIGNYPFTIKGTSGTIEHTAIAILNVFDATFGTLNLTTPADGATGISQDNLVFDWDSEANATSYDIDIATDAGFVSIVESTNVGVNTYTTSLSLGTEYWWRVRAKNNCGDGTYAAASFQTGITVCDIYDSSDTPLAIPDNDPVGVSSIVSATNDVSITDVNVTVNITHTWDSDLTITLISPSATSVELSSGNGGSGDNYTNTVFDDEATSLITAGSAPFTGAFQPEGSLASLIGESSVGDWTLMISDAVNQDTGTLLDWSLELCGELTLTTSNADRFGNFKVYPNPNNGEFTVLLSSSSNSEISVNLFDLRGRKIFDRTYPSAAQFSQTLRLDDVRSGVYLLKVSDGARSENKKIIIE